MIPSYIYMDDLESVSTRDMGKASDITYMKNHII